MTTPHDQIMEDQALDTMNVNAEIVDSGLTVKTIIKVKGRFNDGAARFGKPPIRTQSWDLTDFRELETFLTANKEEKLKFINKNLANTRFRSCETIKDSTFQPLVTLYFKLNYFNGDVITVKNELKLNLKKYSAPLLVHYTNYDPAEVKVKKEVKNSVQLQFNDTTYSLEKTQKPQFSVGKPMDKFVYTYLSSNDIWVEGELQVTQTEDKITIKFCFPEYTIESTFEPPFFDASGIKKLMSIFNCSDPLNLNNRQFEFTFPWLSSLGTQYNLLQIQPTLNSTPSYSRILDSLKRTYKYHTTDPFLDV